ncbi:hypothetical protein M885DRAFT_571491 [Pelagophyceae sp. CCMP2097]|nr:hypothetical protein M885DRAFT_571491 [Pelagophyceae sp. CCMP2097]
MAAPLVSLAALSALAEESPDEGAFDLDADVGAFLAASAERRTGRAPRCTAAEQRRRKALTDMMRKAAQRAYVEDGLLVQPPRAVAVLELLDWAKELAPEDQCDFPDDEPTTVNSRGDCLRLMSEYGEVQTWDARFVVPGFVVSGGRNEASGVAPCLTLFETRGVCTQGRCPFTFTWKCGRAAHRRRGRDDDDCDFPDALDHGYRDVDFDETGEATAAKKWTLQTRTGRYCGH